MTIEYHLIGGGLLLSNDQQKSLERLTNAWEHERSAFWTLASLSDSLRRPDVMGLSIASQKDSIWLGAIFLEIGPFTADILYLFLLPEARGQGLAIKLLKRAELELLQKNPMIEHLFLEVSSDNLSAIKTYQTFGMKYISTRKKYYRDGSDAHVYRKSYQTHVLPGEPS